tara:strand:- start:1305 stop:1700 length:396 start_codon:yes stop_codon:yes gene_type:complete
MSKLEQTLEERKKYLAELNQVAIYTGTILHGEDLSKTRIRQLKKYFNKTFNLLHRLSSTKGDITNNSFRYCYGGKLLGRKVLIDLGFVSKKNSSDKKMTYSFLLAEQEINLELVSRIIVEVYLSRNDIREI